MFLFRIGRLGYRFRTFYYLPGASRVEGNNRWVHRILGFWWRYDDTGDGTRD